MDRYESFNCGAALMRAEIAERLEKNPEALSPEQACSYPWGESLRESMGPCHDAEFAEAYYGARRELREAQAEYDRQERGVSRNRGQFTYLTGLSLPWAVERGVAFARTEIAAYVASGGPANMDWSWESPKQNGKYIGGSFTRLSRSLDLPFDSGPCCLAAHDARNAELIRWSESDDPEAVKVRTYAAALPLYALTPVDHYGNIGYDACVLAGEAGENGIRVILPLGFKWAKINHHHLMRLKPEAGPPRFLNEEEVFGIYELGVNTPAKYDFVVGTRVQSRGENRHGKIVDIFSTRGSFFVHWDGKRHIGDSDDWVWWWQVEPENVA